MEWYQFPITHGFIPTFQGLGTDTPHYAVDIGTPFHTPITALLPGTVVQEDYASWGGEIFIKPDDPQYPEYYIYHPDRLEVFTGQHVTAGQEIALSGGENPGYPGAEHPAQTQWSSGPHTHVGWFTRWQSTTIGTRPYGPDFMPFLNAVKTGKVPVPPSTPAPASTGAQPTPGSGNWTAIIQSGLVRAALFMVALILIGFGFYMIFEKQVDGVAKRAVELAVAA